MKSQIRSLVVIILMVGLASVIMGVQKCGEDDKLAVTQVALATVQIGASWMNVKVTEKCKPEPHGGWTPEDCKTWETNWPKVTDVVTNVLPWAIDRLWKTTTPEERHVTPADRKTMTRKIESLPITGR